MIFDTIMDSCKYYDVLFEKQKKKNDVLRKQNMRRTEKWEAKNEEVDGKMKISKIFFAMSWNLSEHRNWQESTDVM